MDLIVFSKSELPVAIAVLNAVAVDPHHLSTAETTFLETLVTLHGASLEMADRRTQQLEPVAHSLTSPHSRRRLVQLAIAFAMLSGTITDGQMERLEGLARSPRHPCFTVCATDYRGLAIC